MSDRDVDAVEFDEIVAVGLAQSVDSGAPRPEVKARLLSRLRSSAQPQALAGFSFLLSGDEGWLPHTVPGVRMKVLSLDRQRDYAMLLLDVAPGATFPPHHHGGGEECYVLSGSLTACGRRIGPGDFHHADAGSDHDELVSE